MSRKLTFLFAAVLSIIDPTAALPAGATPANQAAIDGEAFDRAFVERMIKEHEEAIELLHAPAGDAEVNHVARNGRT
jgi:predicted outer membrane protein